MSKSILHLTRKKHVGITLGCTCGISDMEKVHVSDGFSQPADQLPVCWDCLGLLLPESMAEDLSLSQLHQGIYVLIDTSI